MKANDSNSKSSTLQWLDVLPCPGDAMERVVSQPVRHSNWIVPTLLVSAIFALSVSGSKPTVGQNQVLYKWQIEQLAQLASIGISTLFGLMWSAWVLWAMARFIFKTRVHFFKAVEVVGLSGVIVALSALTSLLLGIMTDHSQSPLLPHETSKDLAAFPQLLSVHLFNLWFVIVLAIGLSKLTKTDWKECILWTFSYWFVLRLLLT
ncbi:MAG: hypothetical protein JWM99_2152 [Verrucomicrobiales bacterium]|nr:hypothetical protein [Verrucomicrobiales bacterium]